MRCSAGARLADRQFRVTPKSGYGGPHVVLKWRAKSGEGLPESKTFMSKYAMLLQFGKPTGGELPGRVYRRLKDDQHGVVAGTFTVRGAAADAAPALCVGHDRRQPVLGGGQRVFVTVWLQNAVSTRRIM